VVQVPNKIQQIFLPSGGETLAADMSKMNGSSQCVHPERHLESMGKGGNITEDFAQLTAVKAVQGNAAFICKGKSSSPLNKRLVSRSHFAVGIRGGSSMMASHVSDESKVAGWTYELQMWNTIESTRNMQQADIKIFKMVLKAYFARG
jgi:hypothetical protein